MNTVITAASAAKVNAAYTPPKASKPKRRMARPAPNDAEGVSLPAAAPRRARERLHL